MQLNKRNAELVKDVILNFEEQKLITKQKSEELMQNINIVNFDYKKFSKWCFIFSAFCFLISITNLYDLFLSNKYIRIIISIILSSLFYYLGFNNKNKKKYFLKNFFIFLGTFSLSWVMYEISAFDILRIHYSWLFFIASIVYGIIAYFGKSNLVLVFSILNLASWFSGAVGYLSGYDSYFIGMSKPLNFVFFGIILLGLASIIEIKKIEKLQLFFKTFLNMGLLYLFTALWILSIFGYTYDNYETLEFELFIWLIILISTSFLSFIMGLKYDNYALKSYGITFFLIMLYTKYFEYFWTDTNKFIFFVILALSFYLLGAKAEKIYLLLEQKLGKIKEIE